MKTAKLTKKNNIKVSFTAKQVKRTDKRHVKIFKKPICGMES